MGRTRYVLGCSPTASNSTQGINSNSNGEEVVLRRARGVETLQEEELQAEEAGEATADSADVPGSAGGAAAAATAEGGKDHL